MKKVTFGTLSLVLVLSLLLTSCENTAPKEEIKEMVSVLESTAEALKEAENKEDSVEKAPQKEAAAEEAPLYGNDLIQEYISKEGKFTDLQEEREIAYSYKVPKLLSESKDASKINAEIDKNIAKMVNESYFAVNRGEIPEIADVSYKTTWNDSLVSLFIDVVHSSEEEDTYIYNYDFNTENSLSSREMLIYLGLSDAEFIHQLNSAVLSIFDEKYTGYPERAASVSYDNLNHRNIEIYLDGTDVKAKASIANTDTGSREYIYIPVDISHKKEEIKKAENGFITAILDNNTVTLTFDENEEAPSLPPYIEYGHPYEVEGALLDYKDIFLGNIKKDSLPSLFLISEDGYVSFCDIDSCLKMGNKFFAQNKLPDLYNIVSFEETAKSVKAIDAEGNEFDVIPSVNKSKNFKLTEFNGDDLWHSEHGNYEFKFKNEDSSLKFTNFKEDYSCEGRFYHAGLTSDGYIFPFCLWEDEENYASGFMAVSYEIGDYEAADLSITFLNNTGLAGLPEKGKAFRFSKVLPEKEVKEISSGSLYGRWSASDNATVLDLKDAGRASFESKDFSGEIKTVYSGTWKDDGSTITINLEFSEGTPFTRGGHDVDFIDGSYKYLKGMDGSLVLIPLDTAAALTESQKYKKNFPEIFYAEGREIIETEFTDDEEALKKASYQYANSRGIRANGADIVCQTDDGLLIRVFMDEFDQKRTKAWYVIDPETKNARVFSNNKMIDIKDFM